MPTTITLSQDFLDDFEQSTETAMMNLALNSMVEMKKLAPFAKPSQYPRGYWDRRNEKPGDLVKSLSRKGSGLHTSIESSVPYAVRRNYENKLNPQTRKYIERGIDNVLRGKQSQWWQVSKN